MRSKSKTSVDILIERDALHARVLELELALSTVSAEVEHALRHPDAQPLALHRIGAAVRGAVAPISKARAERTPMSIRECG